MLGWLLAFACAGDPAVPSAADRAHVLVALAALPNCDAAAAACDLASSAARSACLVPLVEACPKDKRAGSWCASLSGVSRDECFFQRAERLGDLDGCADAGAFVDDCRLHLWSRVAPPAGASFVASVDALRGEMVTRGIDPKDHRFWSASFRRLLDQGDGLDRGVCDTVSDAALADACRHTAIALWQDKLNHERDFGHFPCDGGPLPASLAHLPDPDLDAILAQRRADDLCRDRAPGAVFVPVAGGAQQR